MSRILLLCVAFWFSSALAGAPTAGGSQAVSIRLTFDRVPVVDLISAYYSEVEKTSYVVASDVYDVGDRVGLVYESTDPKAMRSLFLSVLRGSGIEVVRRDGVDYIRRAPVASDGDMDVFIYHPRYRDISYFSDLVASIFKRGKFTFQRPVSAPPPAANSSASVAGAQPRQIDSGTSALSLQGKSFDVLVFNGPSEEIRKLEGLLQQLDRPIGQVDISAYVYEFSSSDSTETGLAAVAELTSGSASLKLNAGSAADTNFLAFSVTGASHALNVIAHNLSTDGRFRVLSRPHVRAMSGVAARFSSGDEVPVLGAVQTDRSGNVVPSVEYKPSGVILDVVPTVRDDSIDLSIDQQLSNFVPTANGVNSSPTLIKRQVRTTLSARPGEVLVIGGLLTRRENKSSSKLFGFLPIGRSDTDERGEIIVVLEVSRVASAGL